MKKTLNILLTALLFGAFALPSIFLFTGCSTVSEWVEDNPTKANLAKAGLLTGLNVFLEKNPDFSEHEATLRGAIHFALAEAATAQEAAAILDAQTFAVLDDTDVRAALLAAWQAELGERTTSPDGVPASGPAVDYARALADALGRAQVGSLIPEASSSRHSYELGTTYQTPAWATREFGSHWSDSLWSATAWFSGCDSYAGFRAWHSSALTEAEADAWQKRYEQLARLN